MLKRRVLGLVAAIVMGLSMLACTPEQVAVFKTLNPAQQQAVLAALQKKSASPDCYTAIDRHWHGDKSWARKIVSRESGNNPAAQNRYSSAAGCFQLLQMHAHRFNAVGCSWAQRYDADCNTKAAFHLYREAGRSPWALTDY